MSAEGPHANGYVRLTTLVAVSAPVLTIFAAAVALFVSMSVAPIQKDIDANTTAIRDMRLDIVPRREHEKDWLSQAAADDRLRESIKELQQEIGGTYNTRDAIQRLQEKIDCLDDGLCRRQPVATPPH